MSVVVRCDDIFSDTDANTVDVIWDSIKQRRLPHIISITPVGEGEPLYHMKPLKQGNQWINNATDITPVSKNIDLVETVAYYLRHGSELALHGLKHLDYSKLDYQTQFEHLRVGRIMLNELFDVETCIFVPPFNKYDDSTVKACRELDMIIVPSFYEVDTRLIRNTVTTNKRIREISKQVKEHGNCSYHPYWLTGGWEKEQIQVNDKEYTVSEGAWCLNSAMTIWERFLDLISEPS